MNSDKVTELGSVHFESVNERPIDAMAINEAEYLRILRKVDWRVVSIMLACYTFQFLDKVLINYANVMGLQVDLHMAGNDFSWMATAFFIAFAVAEVPQGYLLQRYPVAKVLGFNIVGWGIAVCCSAAVQNFAGILACRILLGCFEAVISPALVMTTSMWYTRTQSGPRYGIWYCGLGVGQILGGLVSFAAQQGPRNTAFGGWRIMFVALGLCNIVVATVVLLFLPDSVDSAKFLNAEEKEIIHRKLSLDQGGNGAQVFHLSSLWEVFSDLQIWLLFLLTILIVIPSGVITTFSATIILGFGYTPKEAALLNMPSGVISITATLITTFSILRGFPRWLSIILALVPTVIGAGLMSFISPTNQPGKLAGIYLINAIVAPLALIFSWVGANTAGYTKKVAANAAVAIAFSIANIIGPQTFQAADAPQYLPAKITIFGVSGGAMLVSVLLRMLYAFRNRKSSKMQDDRSEVNASGLVMVDNEYDVTDRTNPAFVYVY